jgi:hypothetical protein
MLKGASQAHAGQAKELEKAMKTEADLTKSQIKKVHDKADELPKKDFKDRYGKEGDSVRYAVATNIVKKKEGIKEDHPAKEVYESVEADVKKAMGNIAHKIIKKNNKIFVKVHKGGDESDAQKAIKNHPLYIAGKLRLLPENSQHPAKEVYESIKAVKNKAEKSGMPYGILKKVYDRGMAAWRGGHRPGATQVQWALARVNSFVTKSSGTWGGADKDLAKQVKGK